MKEIKPLPQKALALKAIRVESWGSTPLLTSIKSGGLDGTLPGSS